MVQQPDGQNKLELLPVSFSLNMALPDLFRFSYFARAEDGLCSLLKSLLQTNACY